MPSLSMINGKMENRSCFPFYNLLIISKQWLEEPTFDLVHWYLQLLESEHHHSERYEAKQQELYRIQPVINLNDSESGSTSSSPAKVEQQWDSKSLPNHPSPCSVEYDHGLQTCPDLESMSDNMMFNNIKQFD
jgi:hypothetical protein